MAALPSEHGAGRWLLRAEERRRARAAKTPKKTRRRTNLFIEVEAGVNGDASGDEETEDENDDLDGFIIADEVKFLLTN